MRRLLALAAALVLVLSGCGLDLGGRQPGDREQHEVPALVEMGLGYAKNRAEVAGGFDVEDHDASGRNRVSLDDREWQVCFQSPPADPPKPQTYPADTVISVGVVRDFESCPTRDRGVPRQVRWLNELVGRTAHMAREDLGEDASIDFVIEKGHRDTEDHREVRLNLGDWKVCKVRSLNSNDRYWHGQPVHIAILQHGRRCRSGPTAHD